MDSILVTIVKWEKHNPRKDVKRPSWFSFDNRMVEDDDFIDFNHAEFKAWIYILSKASQKSEPTVRIMFEAAERKSKIATKDFKSAIRKLQELGIVTVDVTPTLRARDVDVTLQTDRQTEQDKTNNNADPNASVRAAIAFDFEFLYSLYPRKEGKAKGLERLKAAIKTQADYDRVKQAITRYAAHCKQSGTETKFIKHFSTFMTSWTDWLDPETGTSLALIENDPQSEWLKEKLREQAAAG